MLAFAFFDAQEASVASAQISSNTATIFLMVIVLSLTCVSKQGVHDRQNEDRESASGDHGHLLVRQYVFDTHPDFGSAESGHEEALALRAVEKRGGIGFPFFRAVCGDS